MAKQNRLNSFLLDNMSNEENYKLSSEKVQKEKKIDSPTNIDKIEVETIDVKEDEDVLKTLGIDFIPYDKKNKKVCYISNDNHKLFSALATVSNKPLGDLVNSIISKYFNENPEKVEWIKQELMKKLF